MRRMERLLEQFAGMRRYSAMVIDSIDGADWFRIPDGCPTNVAWQVGHMAFAEYALCLRICRGERDEDAELISPEFRAQYGRGSVPVAGAENNPDVETLLAVMERVHAQALTEIAGFDDEFLDTSAGVEHPMFETRYGALQWCVHHEFTHAGQISLLRRLLGYEVRW